MELLDDMRRKEETLPTQRISTIMAFIIVFELLLFDDFSQAIIMTDI